MPTLQKTSHPHGRCWWRPDVCVGPAIKKDYVGKVCKRKQQGAQIV